LFEIGTQILKAGQVFLYHVIAAELEIKFKINVTKKKIAFPFVMHVS